jgi:hypothetical protein
MKSRRIVPWLAGLVLACGTAQNLPPEPVEADAGPEVTGGAPGTGGKEASGGSGPASGGSGAAGSGPSDTPADAASSLPGDAAAPSDDAGPSADASPPPAGGPVLFELKDPLPSLVQSHPSGDISWFDDPTEGKVVRLRALDSTDVKERGEFDMDKDVLHDGMTVWVGWRAKLEIANPGQEWRNIYQEKSYGSYQENVPFCLRVDAGTMRLLDQNAKALWTHAPILDKWFSIVMKVVYATPPNGTIELWIDGEPQKFSDGSMVAHLGTWGGGQQNMHWGVYRSGRISGTDVHYISHLRVATSREAATP